MQANARRSHARRKSVRAQDRRRQPTTSGGGSAEEAVELVGDGGAKHGGEEENQDEERGGGSRCRAGRGQARAGWRRWRASGEPGARRCGAAISY